MRRRALLQMEEGRLREELGETLRGLGQCPVTWPSTSEPRHLEHLDHLVDICTSSTAPKASTHTLV